MKIKVNKIGNLARYIYNKKKISFFKNEKYILEKILKNWEIFVGEPIAKMSYPKNLFQKNLIVNMTDSTIYHIFLMNINTVKNKINNYLGEKVVENIEVHKINYKVKRKILDELIENEENFGTIKKGEMPREHEVTDKRWKNKKILKNLKIQKNEEINIDKVILSDEKIFEIHNIMSENKDIDDKVRQKLEKIAINMEKRRICLKELGYVECKKCKSLFKPIKDEKICFECKMNDENKIFEDMVRLIEKNLFIGQNQALKIIKTNKNVYYRARVVLAQQIYSELLYFCIEKNEEINENLEYSFEIRNEARILMEKMIKNYIDCKIGSDNEEVFKIERKKILKKLKREVEFKLQNRYKYR